MIALDDEDAWDALAAAYVVTNPCAQEWGASWLGDSEWGASWQLELSLWRRVQPRILIDIFRALSISALHSQYTLGDVVELGVGAGGSTAFLGLLCSLRSPTRRVVAIDTFRGLPRPNRAYDRAYDEGLFATDEDEVRRWLASLGLGDVVRVHALSFDAASTVLDGTYGLAHLDGDLFESTCTAANAIVARLPKRAAIVCDDAWDESGGVLAAVRATWLGKCTLALGPTGQLLCFVERSGTGAVSTDWVRSLPGYVPFLRECLARTSGTDRVAVARLLDLIGAR
ncbi:MAG TPA: TylF/MycF/NovP-related O-methyltransferase [Nannocystaceae bacterium]|nr:TylF/MycF/NovP-related O-methyltransferase [Nannocystaceae bacterium]